MNDDLLQRSIDGTEEEAVDGIIEQGSRFIAGDPTERIPGEFVPESEFEPGGLYGPEDPFEEMPDALCWCLEEGRNAD